MSRLPTTIEQPPAAVGHGRVLRVKEGYNPNSSSIGTAIPTYLALATASGAVTLFLLNLRSAVGTLLRRRSGSGAAVAEDASRHGRDDGESPDERR